MAGRRKLTAEGNTREQIQQAANALFNEYGFENTSVAMICERAGVGKTTLHYYFPQKKDLIYDLTHYFEDEFSQGLYRVFEKSNYVEQIQELFQIICDGDLKYGPKTINFHFQQLLRDEAEKDYTNKVYQRKYLIPIIRQAQQENQINNLCPPEDLCDALTFAARGVILTWAIEGKSFDLNYRMRVAVESIISPKRGYETL